MEYLGGIGQDTENNPSVIGVDSNPSIMKFLEYFTWMEI